MELEEFVELYQPRTRNAEVCREDIARAYWSLKRVGLTENMTPEQAESIIDIYKTGIIRGRGLRLSLKTSCKT